MYVSSRNSFMIIQLTLYKQLKCQNDVEAMTNKKYDVNQNTSIFVTFNFNLFKRVYVVVPIIR